MKKHEVADIVRENVGRDKVSDPVLDWCLGRGLREIEKRDNFYWMEVHNGGVFDILEDQQDYSIRDYCHIDDFKQAVVLLGSDRTATDPEWFEIVGPEMVQDTKVNFTETDSGKPSFWTLIEDDDNPTIRVWPPAPDQDYRAQLVYYRWTELPASGTSEAHEVLRRWPEALIYLATEQAVLVATKDMEQASVWHSMFVNPNPVINTEYKRIKLYQEQRKSKSRFNNKPSNGTGTLSTRQRTNQQGWF